MARNKHGLGRNIPTKIKEEVRKRCGFGCVICGAAWYDYEHFDPDFKDAKEHRADGITLLCMQHNQKRNRKTLSVETVRKANDSPKSLQNGFSSETFDIGVDPVEVVFAGATFTNCRHLITVNGFPVFSINPPLEAGQPYLTSALLSDSDGLTTLKIEDNVFSVGAENWDIVCEANRITVSRAKNDISLILISEPPHRIIIEKINMEFEGVLIRGDKELLEFSYDGKRWQGFRNVSVIGAHTGIALGNLPQR